jgi:hypothetical protein
MHSVTDEGVVNGYGAGKEEMIVFAWTFALPFESRAWGL